MPLSLGGSVNDELILCCKMYCQPDLFMCLRLWPCRVPLNFGIFVRPFVAEIISIFVMTISCDIRTLYKESKFLKHDKWTIL
jgi:hypothetical protein